MKRWCSFIVFLIVLLLSIGFVSATTISASKSSITLGDEVIITVDPGSEGTYKYINIFAGTRRFDHIKTEGIIFNLNKERFSPLASRVVTYRPSRLGVITFKAYDFGTRTWDEVGVNVNDVNFDTQFVCSRVRKYAVRGNCSDNYCEKKGFENFGCVQERVYARQLCKQVREPDCSAQCPKTYDLEEVKKCSN